MSEKVLWTDAEKLIVRTLHLDGKSCRQIAEALVKAGRRGTTRNAVIGVLARMAEAGLVQKHKQARRVTAPKRPQLATPTRSITSAQRLAGFAASYPASQPQQISAPPKGKFGRDLSPTARLGDLGAPEVRSQCRWMCIELETRGLDTPVCGRKTHAGTSWCEGHLLMVSSVARKPRKAAA